MNVWIAQGFGVGRAPFAPGTFGSVLGLAWFALLLLPGNPWIFLAGTLAGFALSVRYCGIAEKELGRTDPPSVVLDEVTAIPVCFFGWVGWIWWHTGVFPAAGHFFSAQTWSWTLGVFAAFRFFDVLKPWPVYQTQSLPGGWGITVDDFVAGFYVSLVWVMAAWLVGG